MASKIAISSPGKTISTSRGARNCPLMPDPAPAPPVAPPRSASAWSCGSATPLPCSHSVVSRPPRLDVVDLPAGKSLC